MKFSDAMHFLENGKKIRANGWTDGYYIYLDKENRIKNKDGDYFGDNSAIFYEDDFLDNWEIFINPFAEGDEFIDFDGDKVRILKLYPEKEIAVVEIEFHNRIIGDDMTFEDLERYKRVK